MGWFKSILKWGVRLTVIAAAITVGVIALPYIAPAVTPFVAAVAPGLVTAAKAGAVLTLSGKIAVVGCVAAAALVVVGAPVIVVSDYIAEKLENKKSEDKPKKTQVDQENEETAKKRKIILQKYKRRGNMSGTAGFKEIFPREQRNISTYDCLAEMTTPYKTVFDFKSLQPIRTFHKPQRPSEENSHARPEAKFRMDGFLTAKQAAAYTRSNVANRLSRLLGIQRKYIRIQLDRGHMVPSADMQSDAARRATFSYANVVPMHHGLNIGIWRSIEMWTRNQTNIEEIVNGTIGVLQLENEFGENVPIYLLDGNRMPVPEWIYRAVIFANGDCIIFIAYNNTSSSLLNSPNFDSNTIFGRNSYEFDRNDVSVICVPNDIKYEKGKYVVYCFKIKIIKKRKY